MKAFDLAGQCLYLNSSNPIIIPILTVVVNPLLELNLLHFLTY